MKSLLKNLGVLVSLSFLSFPNYSIAGGQEKKYEFSDFGEIYDSNFSVKQMKIVDIDGDGDLDIILTGQKQGVYKMKTIIFENKIPQKYSIAGGQEKKYEFSDFGEIYDSNFSVKQMKIVDIDGDGDLDIILTGQKQGVYKMKTIIFENKIPQKIKEK